MLLSVLYEEKHHQLRMDSRTHCSPEFKRQLRLNIKQQSRRAALRAAPPAPIQKVVVEQSDSAQALQKLKKLTAANSFPKIGSLNVAKGFNMRVAELEVYF
jgi:hypothetical protein